MRRVADFAWRTRDSWSRDRRVVAKAEHLSKGSNPRFVVTSLSVAEIDARTLYERAQKAARRYSRHRRPSPGLCLDPHVLGQNTRSG